ncbi:PREDICTED: syntaxin-17 isoform X2 [Polistes dominula]|uniref:Syntaxin-17 isoform X2 n=1 Tax=Polistes dominula TaxID=743375 RepID=A0ABM1IPE5_POLDO|nr:PREDICTED: syntaxin-17 isoform X2 [Polistes dominula]
MSISMENLVIKQPIRRLEIQINNFNVAIPHHVNLLKRHKNNIKKYESQQDWEKVRKEHINVSRIVKQLKELLYQMDTLRAQVLDSDINEFDKLTATTRSSMMNAIEEYLVLQLDLPISGPSSPKEENKDAQDVFRDHDIQLQEEHEDLDRQQACLHTWTDLQDDITQLHQLFTDFNKIVHDQKESATHIETNIEETQINVNEGAKFLVTASRYKAVTYPLAGAIIGTCVGGPIGLFAGLKIGGLTALGCGILGFTGGSILKKKQISGEIVRRKSNISISQQENVKKSLSLPEKLNKNDKDL